MDYSVQIIDELPSGAVLPAGDHRINAEGTIWAPVQVPPYPQDGRIYVLGPAVPVDGGLRAEWQAQDDPSYEVRTLVRAREARESRDGRIRAFEWRYARYARNERLALAQQDSLAAMDAYVQALADVTSQPGFPWNIQWPEYMP